MIESTTFIRVHNDWVGKNSTGHSLVARYGVDSIVVAVVILLGTNSNSESKFTFTEMSYWLGGGRRQRVLDKFTPILDRMADDGLLKYYSPFKDHYYITDLSELFYPKKFVKVHSNDLNKIVSNNPTRISNATLFLTYLTIKSYINSKTKVGFPSQEKLERRTELFRTTISSATKVLYDLKLIYYKTKGWDRNSAKDLGYVYGLWEDKKFVDSYVENKGVKAARKTNKIKRTVKDSS